MKRFLLSAFVLLMMLTRWFAPAVHADAITLAQTVPAGQQATYQLEIYNETNIAHEYSVTLVGLPATLTATFTQGGPVLDKVTVKANQFGLVNLRVDVPADTPTGHYSAEFTAVREDGATLSNPVALNIDKTYALQIISQNVNLTTFSGQEFTFVATAANTGAASITNMALVLETPTKWIVQSDPLTVATLDPGVEAIFTVKVLVPSSQIAIDQPVKMLLTSDQITSPISTLSVRVQKSPTFLYGAALLASLAVVGVFIYFRAKGRR